MTREIIFDTETTGFDPEKGDRMVEIGAIEIIDLKPTGNVFHQYINPERSIPDEVVKVHGIDDARVANEPTFAQIAQKFADFIGDDSMLVAHNAGFDMKFVNYQFKMIGMPTIGDERVIDTLPMARKKFPGQRVSLDALCVKFGVDNSNRELHGALLDSELLYEVYFELRGGAQHGLVLAQSESATQNVQNTAEQKQIRPARNFPISDTEKTAHADFIQNQVKDSLWLKGD